MTLNIVNHCLIEVQRFYFISKLINLFFHIMLLENVNSRFMKDLAIQNIFTSFYMVYSNDCLLFALLLWNILVRAVNWDWNRIINLLKSRHFLILISTAIFVWAYIQTLSCLSNFSSLSLFITSNLTVLFFRIVPSAFICLHLLSETKDDICQNSFSYSFLQTTLVQYWIAALIFLEQNLDFHR